FRPVMRTVGVVVGSPGALVSMNDSSEVWSGSNGRKVKNVSGTKPPTLFSTKPRMHRPLYASVPQNRVVWHVSGSTAPATTVQLPVEQLLQMAPQDSLQQ